MHAVGPEACGAPALTTASAAAAAGACALPSYCINRQASLPSDVLVSVELDERPEDKWIEVEQRKRADGFIDWQSPSSDYVRALRSLRSSFKLPVDTMLALREHFMSEAARAPGERARSRCCRRS